MTRADSRRALLVAARIGVPFGCALAAGALAAALVVPRWNAPGLPFFLGHPKNVEGAAVAAGFAAALAATLLGPRRPAVVLAAIAGFGVLLARGHLRVVAAAWLPCALAVLGPTLLGATHRRPTGDAPPAADLGRSLTGAALAALAVMAFVLGTEPLRIDVFHHGEVLASALDVLHGGVPFKSYIWPHGVHDTGLAAFWIAAVGKVGTSPVALARATCRALGVVAGYALARRILGTRAGALGVAAVVALLPLHGALPGPAACPDVLYQLGILAFVIAALVALTSNRQSGPFFAGVCLACGYLFRIETGLYGAVAGVAVLASRALGGHRAVGHAAAARRGGDALARGRTFVGACAGLALGVGALLAVSRLVLGWPDGTWLDYTLRELPSHHRDAVGVPFPWPIRGEAASSALPHRATALAWLCFVVALGVETTRALVARGDRREVLAFVATFAALATRSALDRSDAGHFLQWAALPLVTVVLLLAARAREAGWPAPARATFVVLALLWIDGPVVRAAPLLTSPAALAASAAERWRATVEHVSANPPIGTCRDTTMTPLEAEEPRNARFVAAVCTLERLLAEHGARGLVVAHSAPWYHVRLGMPSPSRYFAFARAYTPAAQLELVADLRAARADVLLRARGFDALEIFDVTDAVRVPVVDAYLRARTGGVPPYATPVGDVYFWNERGADVPPALRVPSEETVAYPDAGRRLVFGWTNERIGRFPLVQPIDRKDLAVANDGRAIRLPIPVTSERVRSLPRLAGDDWRGLPAAVDRAAELGRRDREEALRSGERSATTANSDVH